MSRSIHDNRSRHARRQPGGIDWDAIHLKRSVKEGALRSRRLADLAPAVAELDPAAEAAALPIRQLCRSPHWYFPASIADMRAVMARLPRGSLTGLREIRLETGTRFINASCNWYDLRDPLDGRHSQEVAHGVYTPMILGMYTQWRSNLRVFAYGKAPGIRLTSRQHLELELEMLDTLVHEITHHTDATQRMGQGRSWSGYHDHTETYTCVRTRQLVIDIVLPYLREKHGERATRHLAALVRKPRRAKRPRLGISRSERRRARVARHKEGRRPRVDRGALDRASRRELTPPQG